MNKKILIFACLIFFLALVGFILYSNLEIYGKKSIVFPSREILTNEYYAMEQWLKESGHPVRFDNNFKAEKFAGVRERVVVLHSTEGSWDNAGEFIIPWIEDGGYLIISLKYTDVLLINENILKMLSDLGITVENGIILGEGVSEINLPNEPEPEKPIPDMGFNLTFLCDDKNEIFSIKDKYGYVRFAEVSIGKGALTVTGFPYFMYNFNLKEEVNAKLAWRLTGARAAGGNKGVLFVRERQISESKLGKIMKRGNLLPVGISIFLLIVLGFWMVIPVFGLVSVEKQKTSRPIRERFIAEIHFLKKYHALDHYLNIYEREKNPGVNPEKKGYNYRNLINQYRRIFNGTEKF